MDSANYPELPNRRTTAHQTADPPDTARNWTKSCPLCATANHSMSRECFNCGWRGVFCGTEAAGRAPFVQAPLLVEVRSPHLLRSLRSRWEALKSWLFFIGSHCYADPWK